MRENAYIEKEGEGIRVLLEEKIEQKIKSEYDMHMPGCFSAVHFCEVSAALGDQYKLMK